MDFIELAQRICNGKSQITKEESLAILNSSTDWWGIYGAALMVKNHFHQNTMQLNVLMNAKSGLCAEDCGYCAQSKISSADIESYGLLPTNIIYKKACLAYKRNATTFCIATSGSRLSKQEMTAVGETIKKIKQDLPLKICLSVGLSTLEQINYFKSVGVDRLNHNLNTPKDNYEKIATTHTYAQRKNTLEMLQQVNMSACAGFICGMGETDEQLIDLAFELRELRPHSVPINFLIPIEGTKFSNVNTLTPIKCLKILTLMRFIFPEVELRASAGREYHFGDLEHFAFLITDSLFLGDYLTSGGNAEDQDIAKLELLEIDYKRKEM
ncbi:MAG: biotin synthase BioB [Lactococcus chungangensis]|uniref:Biotin synthase n=1 Tax=Pseudolactococcus chungangensis TaxID=451457 RepID=A0A847J258_9LACT|nr:biotin synthase BioB [Bacilli bacterium]NLH34923.1 biotin synthase BioB [Lactococcus chungangensis]